MKTIIVNCTLILSHNYQTDISTPIKLEEYSGRKDSCANRQTFIFIYFFSARIQQNKHCKHEQILSYYWLQTQKDWTQCEVKWPEYFYWQYRQSLLRSVDDMIKPVEITIMTRWWYERTQSPVCRLSSASGFSLIIREGSRASTWPPIVRNFAEVHYWTIS